MREDPGSRAAVAVLLVVMVLALVPWPGSVPPRSPCPREKAALVRKVLEKRWLPILERVKSPLPLECPLHPMRDVFAVQEAHKRQRNTHWQCTYCGKTFLKEVHLDQHLERRHSDMLNEHEDSVCCLLLRYCGVCAARGQRVLPLTTLLWCVCSTRTACVASYYATVVCVCSTRTACVASYYATVVCVQHEDSVCLADYCDVMRCEVLLHKTASSLLTEGLAAPPTALDVWTQHALTTSYAGHHSPAGGLERPVPRSVMRPPHWQPWRRPLTPTAPPVEPPTPSHEARATAPPGHDGDPVRGKWRALVRRLPEVLEREN
ncbi:Zinc finger C2H2-type [Trinorchestia longiramus]|nr:Zinc finger C2H2-type [Trinorchestia longiramus]